MTNRDYNALSSTERLEVLQMMTPAQLQAFVENFAAPYAWHSSIHSQRWREIAYHLASRLDPRVCADPNNPDCACAMCEEVTPLLEASNDA